MSELAASATNSTNSTSQTNGNGAADNFIFVPVSVRMDGQKMQLDFKVDSKTLAAAEQLRMAVVRGGVVENNKGTSTAPSSASCNNNNINSSLSMINGCPPSTSASIAVGQTGVAVGQSGTVSDRTKTALRKIVGPTVRQQTSSMNMNMFQSGLYPNSQSAYIDSYSAPSTPKSDELSDRNDLKSTSKVKDARTLLAEKLRRSKQTTNLNGKKNSAANISPTKRYSVPSATTTTTKKFKNEIHSTPSSPLDVNLNKFTYQHAQQNFVVDSTTTPTSNGFTTTSTNNFYQFQEQIYNGNNYLVSDERISSTDAVDSMLMTNGHEDESYDDVFTLTSMQLLNGNGVGEDFQQETVYIQHLADAAVDSQPPSSMSDYLVDDRRPTPTSSTTRDTVESVCNAVLASCRKNSTDFQNSNVIFPKNSSPIYDGVVQERLQADIINSYVPEHHKPTSKSKSTPSAMCGFVNKDEQKQCRQRCINGYKFCIRHILQDVDAPYHPCGYVKTQGSKEIKCNNAVPHKQNTKFCGTHLIMMGMRQPKTRKKKKISTADDDGCGLITKCLPLPTPPVHRYQQDDYYQADAQVYQSSPTTTTTTLSSTVSTTTSANNIHKINNDNSVHSSTTMPNGCSTTLPTHQFYSIDSQSMNNDVGHDGYNSNYASHSYSTAMNFAGGGQRSSSTCSSSTTTNNANNCFDFVSRPDSQLSGVSPYINGYSNLHSPQSPWKMPTTPNGGAASSAYVGSQNGHSSSDIARNHPELLSKLSTQNNNGTTATIAAAAVTSSASAAGQGLRAFANVVTSAMIEDSNSGYGGGGPFQNQRQQYSYGNPNGNPLMLGDDPFLSPPIQQMMMMQTENNSTLTSNVVGAGSLIGNGMGVMPSPVPSELSVESVGSHVSSTFQPSYQLSSTVQRPSPPISGYQTPSPNVVGNNFGAMHMYGSLPSTSFYSSLVGSPSSSSNLGGVHLVSGSQSSSSSINGILVKNDPAHLSYVLQQENRPATTTNGRKYFSPELFKQETQIVRQTSTSEAAVKTTHEAKAVDGQSTTRSTSKPLSAAIGKPKKVIRLKPKKRRMKMMGKYRKIPAVSQMCRVIEDLQFDKTDLFPLGLEPSSSDSESDDETTLFLPFVQTLHAMSLDSQAADLKNDPLTSNVVSAARRQLYMLKRSLALSNKELRKKNLETKFVGLASRCYPNGVGNALADLHSGSSAVTKSKDKWREKSKKSKTTDVVPTLIRKCLYQLSSDSQVKCVNDALPYANTCLTHILHNVDQKLFRYCTAECKMPSLDVGVSDMPKCPVHQDRAAYRALGKIKLEPEEIKKKVYKSRYIVKKHRKRKPKPTALTSAAVPNDAQDVNMTDDDEESEKEEDSNQEAQAALASVARDCGFGAQDLTDILVRLPDATLIENILGQELSRSAEPTTAATSKEEMDSIDRALTATAGDHNWADVEQFLMEENYKSASSPDDYQVVSAAVNSLHILNGTTTANFSWSSPNHIVQGHQRIINGVVGPSADGGGSPTTTTVTKLLPLRVLPPIEPTTASVVNGAELVSYSYSKQHATISSSGDDGSGGSIIRLQTASRLIPTSATTVSSSAQLQRW